jgi:hypothetical protein
MNCGVSGLRSRAQMIKLLLAVMVLIALALVAGVYLGFNPAILIFAILGFGIYKVGDIGGPALPTGGASSHWGSGHGIYFDRDDVWVTGSDSKDAGGSDDDSPR